MNNDQNFNDENHINEEKNVKYSTIPTKTKNSNSQQEMMPKKLKLSPEERRVIQDLSHEAAIKRGYPFAFILGGTTYFGLGKFFPKMTLFGKLGIVSLVGVVGNLLGKFSYIPTAFDRLETDLPPDSDLREYVLSLKKKRMKRNFINYNDADHDKIETPPLVFPSLPSADNPSIPAIDNSELSGSSSVGVDKSSSKYTSYEELKRQHREKEMNSQFSASQYADTPTDSSRKVRFNKYGDPILE